MCACVSPSVSHRNITLKSKSSNATLFLLYGCESDARRVGANAFTPVQVLTSLTGTALTWDYM